MSYSKSEVLTYVMENDVKFIKLFWTDICGNLKSLSIQPSVLKKAFDEGIAFDGSAVRGFTTADKSDLFLVPDPSTLRVLPWRPQHGRVIRLFCKIKNPDGTPFESDYRNILQTVIDEASKNGYEIQVGTECEFYLCKLDESGMATRTPYDLASYCDLSPLDRCENIRRDIVLNLEQMGIEPVASHHETGAGQNEVDFKYDTALKAADNYFTFRNTVKTIAYRDGAFATFNPKPYSDDAGNGLHINMSVLKDGKNLFESDSKEKEWFVEGILKRIREITAVLNSVPESYERLGKYEAPQYISWSAQNRSQLIRVPAASGEERRFELRSPDCACNLYLALSLLIKAGLEGIKNKEELRSSVDKDLSNKENCPDNIEKLPSSLNDAVELFKSSEFVKTVLSQNIIDAYVKVCENDFDNYLKSETNPSVHGFKRWIMF